MSIVFKISFKKFFLYPLSVITTTHYLNHDSFSSMVSIKINDILILKIFS